MIEELWRQIECGEDVRGALSAVRTKLREEENFFKAADLAGDGKVLIRLLDSEDPKVRKNAAALMGELAIAEAAEPLFLAYERERTLFVRPTLLQALEKIDALPYLEPLSGRYRELCGVLPAENEKKHVREELHALEQILRAKEREQKHTFIGWKEKMTILLTTNPAYRELTAGKLGDCRTADSPLGVLAVTDDLKPVLKIRTFRELLFPVGLHREIALEEKPEVLGEALADSMLPAFLERCHREPAPFYFRVELRCGKSLQERSRYVKRMAAALEEKSGRRLLNSSDSYEFEIRLLADQAGRLHAFLKMNTIPMHRFAYRRESISASVHPSSAALMMELARPYLKERAQVLDPCCGVGTMLVERNQIYPIREAYGIDIFGEAVEKARVNCGLAGLHVNFIHRDYLDFKHAYQFDEIIANMPVRGKRTREEQDRLYEGFFRKSAELIAPGGVMLLYSNEAGFIMKQLRLHAEWKLQQEYVIRRKDQFKLYIIGTREKKNGGTGTEK